MAHQAQDTFVAVLDDGTERLITKGEVLASGHELVKRDASGSGSLFKPLDVDGDAGGGRAARRGQKQDQADPGVKVK